MHTFYTSKIRNLCLLRNASRLRAHELRRFAVRSSETHELPCVCNIKRLQLSLAPVLNNKPIYKEKIFIFPNIRGVMKSILTR